MPSPASRQGSSRAPGSSQLAGPGSHKLHGHPNRVSGNAQRGAGSAGASTCSASSSFPRQSRVLKGRGDISVGRALIKSVTEVCEGGTGTEDEDGTGTEDEDGTRTARSWDRELVPRASVLHLQGQLEIPVNTHTHTSHQIVLTC